MSCQAVHVDPQWRVEDKLGDVSDIFEDAIEDAKKDVPARN